MQIASVAVATPPHHVDNELLLSFLGEADAAKGTVEQVRTTLRRCGSEARFLDLPHRGYAIELVEIAGHEAMRKAGLRPHEIDLLIYCSVARGWLEPSTAAAVQAVLGVRDASCFDVMEACAGWVRALEVADALMRTAGYRNALVVGVEAGMHGFLLGEGGIADARPEHLAGYTIGEAATATVLVPGGSPFECRIRSIGELFDICMIALPNVATFMPDDGRDVPEAGRFVSHSDRLFSRVISELVEMARPKIAEIGLDTVDLFIPHGASTRAGDVVRRALDIPAEKWACGHRHFGNTVAMSMPAALHLAEEGGRLRRGDRVCFLVASAGISFGYGLLTY